MPADHGSGRFALLMNAWSRKAFPLGTTAALSLMISTAAHAGQCFDTGRSRTLVVAPVPSPANACILDKSTMRRTSGACRATASLQDGPARSLYQRSNRLPASAPIPVAIAIASVNQAATKSGESSGQCAM